METDATRMCALLVGLPDVNVLAVEDADPAVPLRVHIETTAAMVGCGSCGSQARLKDRRQVALVDLAAFGRPAVRDPLTPITVALHTRGLLHQHQNREHQSQDWSAVS